ncbi:MAG: hypothetical protein JO347_12590 [Candidatus Eremiobacteraeota bacterium]|nr:hypothetical protein [Candidatus Eremiobacteraeota bacterium]
MRVLGFLVALILIVGVARADVAPSPLEQAQALTENAIREFDANAAAIDQRTGLGAELKTRLQTHHSQLGAYTDPETALRLAQLDAQLVDQLAKQSYVNLGAVHGAAAAVLPSIGSKKRAYPIALYVPSSAAPAKADPPLIIYLHGKGESEADVIASPIVRAWADLSGAVVLAPYASTSDMLSDGTIADLISVASAGADAMPVDRRHIYVAGNSLGGFAAFKLLAAQPDHWAGVLVIEGAVAQDDSDSVAAHVHGKPIYLVAGANDASISAAYLRQLGAWLGTHGALVTYYEQPNGTHSLASVAPMAGKAWHDMLAGVVPASATVETVPSGQTPQPNRP